jgi:hypothetical protein
MIREADEHKRPVSMPVASVTCDDPVPLTPEEFGKFSYRHVSGPSLVAADGAPRAGLNCSLHTGNLASEKAVDDHFVAR